MTPRPVRDGGPRRAALPHRPSLGNDATRTATGGGARHRVDEPQPRAGGRDLLAVGAGRTWGSSRRGQDARPSSIIDRGRRPRPRLVEVPSLQVVRGRLVDGTIGFGGEEARASFLAAKQGMWADRQGRQSSPACWPRGDGELGRNPPEVYAGSRRGSGRLLPPDRRPGDAQLKGRGRLGPRRDRERPRGDPIVARLTRSPGNDAPWRAQGRDRPAWFAPARRAPRTYQAVRGVVPRRGPPGARAGQARRSSTRRQTLQSCAASARRPAPGSSGGLTRRRYPNGGVPPPDRIAARGPDPRGR